MGTRTPDLYRVKTEFVWSARSVSLRLAVLPTASLHFREPSLRQNFAPISLSSLSLPAAVHLRGGGT